MGARKGLNWGTLKYLLDRWSRKFTAFAALAICSILSTLVVSPAQADGSRATVDRIIVQGDVARILLRFDRPITAASAERVRASLTLRPGHTSVNRVDRWKLRCANSVTFHDANGRFDVAYYCGKKRRSLPWGYKLSKKVQSIVVGNVHEHRLLFWRNGKPAPKLAPHVKPAYYHFHGTMAPVYRRSNIECQDYLTFRHNIGPGVKGSVTFAAALRLVN